MTRTYGLAIFDQHAALLAGSAIPPDLARRRGYVSVDTKVRLEQLGVTRAGRSTPGLLIPLLRKEGSTWGYQYRPDVPRTNDKGKPVKYETPWKQPAGLDVPPGVGALLDDPAVTLWITEGTRKADAAAALGLACVSLSGVWNWRGSNPVGGKVALSEWHDVALNGRRVVLAFDSDVVVKPAVSKALRELAGYLTSKGAKVAYLHLAQQDDKAGLDDYIAAGHGVDDLLALVRPDMPEPTRRDEGQLGHDREHLDETGNDVPVSSAEPISLERAHQVFRRWLGESFDLVALDAALSAAAVDQLDGDPVWLLIVSGSGNAKTETVSALSGAGAHVTSTITSEGALLSATSRKDQSKDATGGLLRKIGGHGVLVVKDVTSILSMNRDVRASVLAALREVYDGRWERNVGTDGGRSLTWTGRITVIGAVTTAYDTAHGVIAAMGDRFTLVRVDSHLGRLASGRQALRNVGHEEQMRAELAAAAGGVLASVDPARAALSEDDIAVLLAVADLVTLARTGVERDFRGVPSEAHAPEAPTRFAKMLGQLVRGGLALGLDHDRALSVALRAAGDSVPPLRLVVLADLGDNPHSRTSEVTKRLQRPRATVDRGLQELHLLGLVEVDEVGDGRGWRYTLAPNVDRLSLTRLITRNVTTPGVRAKEESEPSPQHLATDISGEPLDPPVPGLTLLEELHAADPPDCERCHWPLDTLGHETNCELVAR